MRYVILLRGVNVGGSRRVPKGEFQAALVRLGFRDVITYINSGNAVFASDQVPITSEVQTALEGYFGFPIPTLILPEDKVRNIAAAIPAEWTNDAPDPDKSGNKSDVIYLFDSVNTPDILDDLGYRSDIETMLYVDGAILTSISRANQSRGSLQKLMGAALYGQMTIRNINTAKKLAELVAE